MGPLEMHLLRSLLLLLICTVNVSAAEWGSIVKVASPKIPRLEMLRSDGGGVCSAVVFQIDPNHSAFALTAAHCVAHDPADQFDLTVNKHHAKVLLVNRLLDLAIIGFEAKHEAVMALAPQTPEMGTEVAVLGYAFGSKDLAAQFGRISQSLNEESHSVWINLDLIFGDSGGAVLDDQGRLVGINSQIFSSGPAHIAGAVPVESVSDFLDAFRKQQSANK